jgi:hypothetical protein
VRAGGKGSAEESAEGLKTNGDDRGLVRRRRDVRVVGGRRTASEGVRSGEDGSVWRENCFWLGLRAQKAEEGRVARRAAYADGAIVLAFEVRWVAQEGGGLMCVGDKGGSTCAQWSAPW